MARKPTMTEEQQAEATKAIQDRVGDLTSLAHLSEGQTEAQQLQAAYSDERDLVNQLLGQAQMADAFAQFSLTVRTSKLAYVKENKLYKALAGKRTPDGQDFLTGTWGDFCSLLGVSVQKVDEDILNLRQFGEDALDAMSRMGIGYRELRQFRKLPDDSRSALIEAAKLGNHEAVEYLAEELIAKHTKEKEQLTKERDEANADYDAQRQVLSTRAQELDQTKLELEKARRRIQSMPPAEMVKELRVEVTGIAFEAESILTNKVRAAFEALVEAGTQTGQDQRVYMASLLRQIELNISAIRDDYDLPDDVDADATDWMQPGALERAQAAIEQAN